MSPRKLKIEAPQRSKDEICEIILKVFYNIHKKARGLKSSRAKISIIKKVLKQQGLTEQEIVNNLEYLIQTGWILKEPETYQVRTKRGTINPTADYYRISDKGIDHFEGASVFQRLHPPAGINITNIQGITIVGDSNIVNAQYSDLYRNLSLLAEEMRRSDKLSDEEKLNYSAEIDTIKSQLSKTKPDRSIIAKAWDSLKPLATVAGIASFFEKVQTLIAGLLL